MPSTLVTAALSALLVALLAPHASHAQSRCSLPISAHLTDAAGTALDGTMDVELQFYVDAAPEATPTECRTFGDVPVTRGWMRIDVDACGEPAPTDCGATPIADVLRASDGLWVAVLVDGTELGPRVAVGAVPFAVEASNTSTLQGLEPDAFEPAGTLAAHEGNPDAHHPADSAGIDIRPTSVDLGPDADDELTAEIVTTLTGGGDADTLHTHASGHSGGLCYTAWGESECVEDFTLIYSGYAAQQSLVDRGRSFGATGAPVCVSLSAVSSTARINDWDWSELGILGQSADAITVAGDGYLTCALCCR